MNVSNRLEHVETSIDSAQAVLDRVQRVVTGLDEANQRVERVANVLRQAAIALVVGGVLLGALALRRHTR